MISLKSCAFFCLSDGDTFETYYYILNKYIYSNKESRGDAEGIRYNINWVLKPNLIVRLHNFNQIFLKFAAGGKR